MTQTSIQTSFHRIQTGLHHIPSSPQILNSSRVKHHLLLFILLKCFCQCRYSEENIHFLLSEEHPEQKLWTLCTSFGICCDYYIWEHLYPSPSALSYTILPTENIFLSTTLALNPQGMNPMQIEELWTNSHLHWYRLQQGSVWGWVLAR